jgi:hypothetical protein
MLFFILTRMMKFAFSLLLTGKAQGAGKVPHRLQKNHAGPGRIR